MKLQTAVTVALCLLSPVAAAQRHAWQEDLLPYRRQVRVAPRTGTMPRIVMTRFFTHGTVDANASAVAVYGRSEQVPSRVLQVGPGDQLRLAFQTRKNEQRYQIYYGGDSVTAPSPQWTTQTGLFLETRKWKGCELDQLSAVREAFESAEELASGYVPRVFHRYNPFQLKSGPFFSHYSGTIRIPRPGRYLFFTSSQDCSFLLIDDEEVVAAPGRHGPGRRAKIKGEIQLSAGSHQFEYWHAASGNRTCAVAAWQEPDAEKPAAIPPAAFGWDGVARVAAERPEHETDGPMPDVQVKVAGEASIPGNDQWAVRVEFRGTAPVGSRSGSCTWDFGDGQSDNGRQPTHIYLHPGQYAVTLNVRQRGDTHTVTNKIRINRFVRRKGVENKDEIDDYLPIIDAYDVATLDAASQLQLVRLRLARSDWKAALEAGMDAFSAGASSNDDDIKWEMARAVGPVATRRLEDSSVSLELWKAAGRAIQADRYRVRCALAAADVALNELLKSAEARPFLAFAEDRLGDSSGQPTATLHRLWGDWHARNGDPRAARAAYKRAADARQLDLNAAKKNARRGAFSRSAEAFLRDNDLVRAAEQLSQWQRDFPLDKTKGYLSTLLARYWLKREKPRVAIAVAEDLLTVSPQSPYADRLLIVQATAEETLGRVDRAISTYQSLLTDYPGSPRTEDANKSIARLQSRDQGE